VILKRRLGLSDFALSKTFGCKTRKAITKKAHPHKLPLVLPLWMGVSETEPYSFQCCPVNSQPNKGDAVLPIVSLARHNRCCQNRLIPLILHAEILLLPDYSLVTLLLPLWCSDFTAVLLGWLRNVGAVHCSLCMGGARTDLMAIGHSCLSATIHSTYNRVWRCDHLHCVSKMRQLWNGRPI